MAAGDSTVTINVFAKTAQANQAIGKVGKTIDTMGTATSRATTKMSGTNAVMGNMARSVLRLASAYMTLQAGIGVLRGLTTTNLEFADSMAHARAVTEQGAGFTIKAYQEMGAEARRLGATTRFSAGQAADGLKFLGMAGFTAEQATKSLSSTLLLAQAGALELGRSADIVSNIMTAFGATAEETGRFVDVLAKTAATSNTNVGMLGDSMKFAAPIAAGLGLKFENVAAAMGILGNAGIQAGMSGAGLRMVLSQLTSEGSMTVKTLKAMGVEYSSIDPKANNLITVFKNLKSAGVDVEAVFSAFDARAANVAQVLVTSADEFENYAKEVNDSTGAAKQMAATMDGTLSASLLRSKSAVSESALLMGEALTPALVEASEAFAKFITKANESGAMKAVGKQMASAFRTGTNVLSNLVPVISSVVSVLKKFSFVLYGLVPFWVANRIAASAFFVSASGGAGLLVTGMRAIGQTLKTLKVTFRTLKAFGAGTFSALRTSAIATAISIKGALISTGIGILVVALGFVVEKLMSIGAAAKEATRNMTDLRDQGNEINIQYNISIGKAKTKADLDAIAEQVQSRIRTVRARMDKDLSTSDGIKIKVGLLDGTTEERDLKDVINQQGNHELKQLAQKLAMITEQGKVLAAQLKVDKEHTKEAEKALEVARKTVKERKKLMDSTGTAIDPTEDFFAELETETFDVQRTVLLTVQGFEGLDEYKKRLAELTDRRLLGEITGSPITGAELEELQALIVLKGRLGEIDTRAEEGKAASTALDDELRIINAKLAGQDAYAAKLQEEGDIRKKTLDLEKDGVTNAKNKATALIKAKNALAAQKEVEKKKTGSSAGGLAVTSLQAIGGGGGVGGGDDLVKSSARTATATERTAEHTALLVAKGPVRDLGLGKDATPQTAAIGTGAQSQGQLTLLSSILEVLQGIREDFAGNNDVITIT